MHFRLLILFLLGVAGSLQAQPASSGFDTLVLQKPRAGRLLYQAAIPAPSEIQLKLKAPRRGGYPVRQVAGDATRNLLSGLTGIHVTTGQDQTFLLRGMLSTNRDDLDWQVNLVVPGELEKTSRRVRNNDGSKSVETSKTTKLFWQDGAAGTLLSGKDSIGGFRLYLSPLSDSVLGAYFSDLFAGARNSLGSLNITQTPPQLYFAAIGRLNGKPLVLLFESRERIAWIFLDKELACVFRADADNEEGLFVVTTNSRRVVPLLLYRGGSAALPDCLRLGLLGRLLYKAVSTDTWTDEN